MYLEEIIEDIQLESDKFEGKAILNREDIVGWLKSIAGFANASGGDFYIGVEDKTNKLIGFDRKDADNERNYFNNQVNEHLTPRPQMKISFIRYEINGDERFVIKVSIEESPVKPVILQYKNIPSIFMRRDGFTNGATYEEIIEMSVKSKNTQYDILVSDIKYVPEKLSDLRAFYEKHNDGAALKEKALQSLGFVNKDGFLLNGAVLFLDDYKEKKTEVQCSVFSGFNKGSERIVTINRFNGNITSTINYVMDFVNQRMNHSVIKLDDTRINIDSYPARALFEGVINAVAHRDYYLDGTQIQVDIFKDRLEISSPGGFYRGEKLGKTYDLSNVISKRRNELIAGVLVTCNVMEAAGTGFDKIMEEYASADEAHKPYIYSTSDHFTLVLPDLTYDRGVEDEKTPVLNFAPVPGGTEMDGKVLSFCYLKAHKVSEIAEYLGISDSTYFRKQVLDNLEKHGYLEKSKVSRAAFYKTNLDMVDVE
ncbi:MAG: putative DNA binding domain-containing protein [Clostridium sp.]|nr:putative DNA binding domain-containing protein [Clostridium sp.]MCM1398871.1 putative DNA binding domain-containing protein [Clostridium sp.]MCM1458729.1 putative DNA binding domain-containing protein [Bacteroides sp.]